jgi:hypothetical protein
MVERLPRSLHRPLHIRGGTRRDVTHDGSAGRVDDINPLIACRLRPFSGDENAIMVRGKRIGHVKPLDAANQPR